MPDTCLLFRTTSLPRKYMAIEKRKYKMRLDALATAMLCPKRRKNIERRRGCRGGQRICW